MNYLAQFVKPGGPIGIAGAGLVREFEGTPPQHLRDRWTQDLCVLHDASWWQRHWERTGLVDVELADLMPDGWQLWLEWQKTVAPDNSIEIAVLESDRGSCWDTFVSWRDGDRRSAWRPTVGRIRCDLFGFCTHDSISCGTKTPKDRATTAPFAARLC